MLNTPHIRKLIDLALTEDIPAGDVTSESIGGLPVERSAVVIAKEPCVVCGLPLMPLIAEAVSSALVIQNIVDDGEEREPSEPILEVHGPLEKILIFERTALNFLQHLSGIATHVKGLVKEAGQLTLLDTRKTLPGYRDLEKYAVRVGGGTNHRMSLSDQILIKDNHVDGARKSAAELVKLAKMNRPAGVLVEVEIRSLQELPAVIAEKPDIILLDNMKGRQLSEAVELIQQSSPEISIEVSGNITLERFPELSSLGAVRASLGALTYGAKRVDLSLLIKDEAR